MTAAVSLATLTAAALALDTPIVRGEQQIGLLGLRKPAAGELRGIKLLDLAQMDVTAVIKLLPRITEPTITEAEAAALDLPDLMACAAEIAGFLLPKAQRPDSLPS